MRCLGKRGSVGQPVPKPCYFATTIINALTDTQITLDVSRLEVASVKMPPPKRPSGRPPYRRHKSAIEHLFENKKRYRCAICHATGHTSKTHDAWVRQKARVVQGRQTDPEISTAKRARAKAKLRTFTFDFAKYAEDNNQQ